MAAIVLTAVAFGVHLPMSAASHRAAVMKAAIMVMVDMKTEVTVVIVIVVMVAMVKVVDIDKAQKASFV
ncbi:hypothetical protein [Burkholderia sp. Ac-20353]|uniref:hypothetical protein n=1 Tax=Burkholderia sp. Ac-20353 TaxID=2703894 RepID=UPI00197C6113|nr:hypothetical protein [Burkholderia sp. Ac-20353]MBN3789653.1 hypothetical protein [Burkholderia sp. Ac-20353]